MRVPLRSALVYLAASAGLFASAGLLATPAAAGASVNVLVLKEHGVGSATQAQPFLDRFVSIAQQQNGWADAKGQYETKRSGGQAYVQAQNPHYGILSLAAFLAFRGQFNVEPIGTVAVANAGGQQYFLVSKTAGDLAGCKGKRLATDHADDAKFIDNVVLSGRAKLGDFTLVTTTRPTQTLKKVLGDEAECALIDDAQLAELSKISGAAAVKQVWSSDRFPALVMVAFPSAPADERKAFQASLPKLCAGNGQQVCADVGVQSMKPAGAADYAAVVAAYK